MPRPIQCVNAPAFGTEVIVAGNVVSADWWDPAGAGLCIWAAYQPKGAVNLAASYNDLSGNGNNCGPGVAPTWDAVNGWRFNGVNQWLDTLFQPQNDQSQSMIIQYTNLVFGGAHHCLSGCNQVDRFKIDTAIWGINTHRYANGGFIHIGVASPVNGNYCVAGNQGYLNGGPDGGLIGVYGAPLPRNVYIGATNNWGGPAQFCQVYIQAYALYDCTLTAPQVLAVATAMAAL
jgi:hypothetical protein